MQQFELLEEAILEAIFYNPVFVISAPRSGSTLLFELLSQSPDFFTVGGESHKIYSRFPTLQVENENFDSGCLSEIHADATTSVLFRSLMASMLVDREGVSVQSLGSPRRLNVLEKTPRNALNIPFILSVFPRARFVFLYRDPRQNVSSIIEAWEIGLQTGRFVTYPKLPGWDLERWCMLLPPDWREMNGKNLVDIAVFQWLKCNEFVLEHLRRLDNSKWMSVNYEQMVRDPFRQVSRVCKFASVRCDTQLKKILKSELPLSSTVVSKPSGEKWRRHADEIRPFLPALKTTYKKLLGLQR